jgi:putative transposase
VLDRVFEVPVWSQEWLADFTYIRTAEGWLYVAFVIDLYSRCVFCRSMKTDMTAQLVTDALMMALWWRGRARELLYHSDQGSQGGLNRSSQHGVC